MANNDNKEPTATATGTDSTVDDWHGQDVDRDIKAADEALAAAGGDQAQAEKIFDATRPEHRADRFNVPADQREGTVSGGDGNGPDSTSNTPREGAGR